MTFSTARLLIAIGLLLSSGAQAASPAKTSISTTLTPRGFQPSSLTTTSGAIRLFISVYTGGQTNNFQVQRSDTNSIKPAIVDQNSKSKYTNRTYRDITLTPGTYILTETSKPEWRCVITVN